MFYYVHAIRDVTLGWTTIQTGLVIGCLRCRRMTQFPISVAVLWIETKNEGSGAVVRLKSVWPGRAVEAAALTVWYPRYRYRTALPPAPKMPDSIMRDRPRLLPAPNNTNTLKYCEGPAIADLVRPELLCPISYMPKHLWSARAHHSLMASLFLQPKTLYGTEASPQRLPRAPMIVSLPFAHTWSGMLQSPPINLTSDHAP